MVALVREDTEEDLGTSLCRNQSKHSQNTGTALRPMFRCTRLTLKYKTTLCMITKNDLIIIIKMAGDSRELRFKVSDRNLSTLSSQSRNDLFCDENIVGFLPCNFFLTIFGSSKMSSCIFISRKSIH